MGREPPLPFQLRTTRFEMQTDVSMALLQHLTPVAEQAYQSLTELPCHMPTRDHDKPIRVWFLRDDETYRRFIEQVGRDTRGSIAIGGSKIYVRGDPTSLYETRRRFLHELEHAVHVRAKLNILPNRLCEGFCDLCSLHTWDGQSLRVACITGGGETKMVAHANNLRKHLRRGTLDFTVPLAAPKADLGLSFAVASLLLAEPAAHVSLAAYLAHLRTRRNQFAQACSLGFANEIPQWQKAFEEHVADIFSRHEQADAPPDLTTPLDAVC